MNEVFLIFIAYLIGSVPTAVWISKVFFGFDIREYGSGNSGATNTYRVLGAKWGTVVMVIDMLKAIAAVKLAFFLPQSFENDIYLVNMQLGLAGHSLKFLFRNKFELFSPGYWICRTCYKGCYQKKENGYFSYHLTIVY